MISSLCCIFAALIVLSKACFGVRTYFYVGGHYVNATLPGANTTGQYMVGQIYVEKLLPRETTKQYPIIFISGNGQTSTNFLNTPDGREGWASYFLGQGYAIYLTDQSSRGRSFFLPGGSDLTAFSTAQEESLFTAPEKQKPLPYPQAALHTQWPGAGLAGDPIFDAFYASQVQALSNGKLQVLYNNVSYNALLDKIGPSFVITHSQSGPYGFSLADTRPELVRGLISLEPQGPPIENWNGPPFQSGYSTTGGARSYGLTAVPVHYDPSVSSAAELDIELVAARNSNSSKCYRQVEPARQLVNIAKVPSLLLTSECSYHTVYDYCTVEWARQAGVKMDHVPLETVGIHGNGHFLFLEKNNLEIAAKVVSPWLEKLGVSNSTS
ncbi:uncharacterized protein MYCFIDRAFT_201079 [Pseudocercospora fijiensis CIRAD86]|uniref:Uncharacterized protein n=1 Tax=Pseudocercospora fijiensis (strain CIRAD86) TaxID=383855 RepID=N1Q5S7_PSEFD|nr:uncharacterized protein MYCFIDRAFT_201079 [Pseudocercospora fijiensis CIRAD86]EME87324.1 hypothetical protein MYCFIDRAFT_201079 [Pseudocercospora fijiensis CIRAD86]